LHSWLVNMSSLLLRIALSCIEMHDQSNPLSANRIPLSKKQTIMQGLSPNEMLREHKSADLNIHPRTESKVNRDYL
jgi:hypothetical protein